MKVSVVMPVFNAESTVLAAIDSLKAQTFSDLELIVINDGSIDGTGELLRSVSGITLLDCPHRGIVPALNEGLQVATGAYIARMDADDICHPERIEKQVAYLGQHPEIGLVGCCVGFGGDGTAQTGYATYVDWINSLVASEMIFLNRFVESPFAHPSVLFRRELVDQFGGYRDGDFPEDYELWLRWMSHGVAMAKVDEDLLVWSDPPTRLSRTDDRYSIDAFYQIKFKYMARWLKAHNPHDPEVIIWGAGRTTRKRAAMLEAESVRIKAYIDLKPRTLDCGTPVIHHDDLPEVGNSFVIPMVGNRGARDQIRNFLSARGYVEGVDCIFAA